MHPLRGHCEKNMGLVAHSQAISTPQIKRSARLNYLRITGTRIALEHHTVMKPTLLFAFCALIMLVAAAPAQSPQRDPAHEELTALIKEVRAQQAAVAANQAKINEKLATLAETIRVARIYSSRGGR
jgi:hypothetical protein